MKKKRRIEITAFRRTVTVYSSGSAAGPGKDAPLSPDCVPGSADNASAQLKPTDLLEAELSSIDDGSSTELQQEE